MCFLKAPDNLEIVGEQLAGLELQCPSLEVAGELEELSLANNQRRQEEKKDYCAASLNEEKKGDFGTDPRVLKEEAEVDLKAVDTQKDCLNGVITPGRG